MNAPDVIFERQTFERGVVRQLAKAYEWPDGFFPLVSREESPGEFLVALRAFDKDGMEFRAFVSERVLRKALAYAQELNGRPA